LTLAFLIKQDYIVIRETKRKCRSTGSSKTTSGNPVGERFWHSRSSPAGRIIAILCETLEGDDRERRKRSVEGKVSPRPAFSLVSHTERRTSGITSGRASGSWV
jgi:ribosomal protein S28E/S33